MGWSFIKMWTVRDRQVVRHITRIKIKITIGYQEEKLSF